MPAIAPHDGLVLEEGVASWYGEGFRGRLTASGEPFDDRIYTVAHPWLPFGTILVVTNLDNGLRTTLRVNDRGPYVAGRIADCSAAGADALGFRRAGLACVRLELLELPPQREPDACRDAGALPP